MKELFAKIILLGNAAVGKTSLIRRFVYDEFNDEYIATIGAKVTKKVIFIDDSKINLLIWDLLGQKMMRISNIYFQGSSAAIFVADLTRIGTLEAFPKWYENFTASRAEKPTMILLNKKDLKPEYDVEYARKFVSDFGDFELMTTSAKTGENVNEAFDNIGRQIHDNIKKVIEYES